MGKASSAKKVARAARAAGGKRRGQRRNLGFPMVIALIVVAGISLIVWARLQRTATAHPLTTEHWHAAYNFNICGTVQPPDVDLETGLAHNIHTHNDKVVHIHPQARSFAGQNADLGVFFDTIGLVMEDDSITLPDGTTFEEGTDDCDGEAARLVVARWNSAEEAESGEEPSQIFTDNFRNIRFRNDREAYTIAFLPEDQAIPAPDSMATLDQLSDVIQAPTTTAPGETVPTVPGETTVPAVPGETTVPGTDTSTSAP
ncbi:MAG: hypothetical protein ACRD29_19185 [Acidimicrobiales bacterium]